MNKILLVAAALLFGSATFAQTATPSQTSSQNEGRHKGGRGHRGGGSPENRAKKQTSRLVKELGLDATQEAKTYDAIFNAVNSRMAAKAAYPDDNAAMREKGKSIQTDLENQFKNIFTPEQYKTYLAKKEEVKSKMKGRRAEKRNDTSFDLD